MVEITSISDSGESSLLNVMVTLVGGEDRVAPGSGVELTNRARGISRSAIPKISKANPKKRETTRSMKPVISFGPSLMMIHELNTGSDIEQSNVIGGRVLRLNFVKYRMF